MKRDRALGSRNQPTGLRRHGTIPKVCLVSTSGGHLRQLAALAPALMEVPAYLVSVDSPDVVWAFPGIQKYRIKRITRNPAAFVLNWIQSLAIVLEEEPSAIITTGAGDAFPTVLIGAALGVPVLFIESVARVSRPSLFGRLVCRFAHATVVQWPALVDKYREATLTRPLLKPPVRFQDIPPVPSILVLTGTHTKGFERLLKAIDSLLCDGKLDARVFAQIGHSTYNPTRYPYERFVSHEKLMQRLRASDLLVTHDGSGSIADGLEAGKRIFVVPRVAEEREVSYRSTSELAYELSRLEWVTLVEDPYELPELMRRAWTAEPRPSRSKLPEVLDVVRDFLRSVSIAPIPASSLEMPRGHSRRTRQEGRG